MHFRNQIRRPGISSRAAEGVLATGEPRVSAAFRALCYLNEHLEPGKPYWSAGPLPCGRPSWRWEISWESMLQATTTGACPPSFPAFVSIRRVVADRSCQRRWYGVTSCTSALGTEQVGAKTPPGLRALLCIDVLFKADGLKALRVGPRKSSSVLRWARPEAPSPQLPPAEVCWGQQHARPRASYASACG